MFEQVLNKVSLHGNWIDMMLLILITYFVLTQKGFINTLLEALAFIFSIVFSYNFYSFFGKLLVLNFSLPAGISNVIGFFIAWFLAELLFSVFLLQLLQRFLVRYQKHPLNVSLGFVAAIIQASLIFLFFVSFIFAFPIRPQIKQAILDSRTGPFFVNLSSSVESGLKNIFGQAVNETLNFLTIKPESSERVDLGFKAPEKNLTIDAQSESIMYQKLNEERVQRGIPGLSLDSTLRDVARAYATQMFENGFFSHISGVDGSTPADRATRVGISYTVIGENLAYAPDVYIAHQGLMNSEGHRKNILSSDFGKVGIGVIDGGIYGKMFVQEFTN